MVSGGKLRKDFVEGEAELSGSELVRNDCNQHTHLQNIIIEVLLIFLLSRAPMMKMSAA